MTGVLVTLKFSLMLIIHDKRLPREYTQALGKKFPQDTLVPFNGIEGSVYDSIAGHPDIFIFQIDKTAAIYAPGTDEGILDLLSGTGVGVIEGEMSPHGEYPLTAGYNAVRVGKHVFHNEKCTDPFIKSEIKRMGLELVHVEQGYTRCSVISLGEKALITSDKGICDRANEVGKEVLYISRGSVLLPGEDYGFMGGASGIVGDNRVLVMGDIKLHQDSEAIAGFIEEHAGTLICLEGLPLYDAGGVLFF